MRCRNCGRVVNVVVEVDGKQLCQDCASKQLMPRKEKQMYKGSPLFWTVVILLILFLLYLDWPVFMSLLLSDLHMVGL